MLCQRRRRWHNIKPEYDQRLLLTLTQEMLARRSSPFGQRLPTKGTACTAMLTLSCIAA